MPFLPCRSILLKEGLKMKYTEERVNLLKEHYEPGTKYELNMDGKIIIALIGVCIIALFVVDVLM